MITYGELNLAEIRDKVGLDFAHYTYKKGQCSCCFGPKDLPKRYWKDHIIPENKKAFSFHLPNAEESVYGKDYISENEYTYLLFKNADNCGGHVKRSDTVYGCYIEWGFPYKLLNPVCNMLKEQLGSDYEVVIPKDCSTCIQILVKEAI